MSLLTTSQLTFCDLKDSYSVYLSSDCIGLACNSSGLVVDAQTITINYSGLMGVTRVGLSCAVSELPNGVTATTESATADQDGKIILRIEKDSNIGDEQTASIKVVFTTTDSSNFTFEKYITFVKYMHGDSSSSSVNFQIYSVNGFEFSDTLTSIELKTATIQNGNLIDSDIIYCWKWWNDESSGDDKYQVIDGATSSTLTVNYSEIYAFSSLKCECTYNGVTYTDYVSLTKKNLVYTAIAKFFNGNNVIASDADHLILYIELYKNNTLEDTLMADSVYTSDSNSVNDSTKIITTNIDGTYQDGDRMYFVCKNSGYDVVLGQYNAVASQWKLVDQKYVYQNDFNANTSSNVIYIQKEKINKSLNINVSVYNKNSIIARTSTNVLDLNDPIINSEPPANPQKGQLWLNTSVSPSILKMWDGSKWVDSGYQNGNVVYTSKPSSYSKGDLWILADGETFTSSQQKYTSIDLNESNIQQFFNISNGSEFSGWNYSDYESGGIKLVPQNIGNHHNITASITLTTKHDLNVVIGGMYNTESRCDKISLQVGGDSILEGESGYSSYREYYGGYLPANSEIVLTYQKDTSLFEDDESNTYFVITGDYLSSSDGYNYGPGSILKAIESSDTFNASHWVDVDKENTEVLNNIKQYFVFSTDTGLKIGQKDDKFYVNISSTEMGFYDNSDSNNPSQKVVSIGNKSATIKNARIQDDAQFDCNATFNKQINIQTSGSTSGFVWKIESNGSLSLSIN